MKTIKDKQLLVGADFAGYPLKEAVVAHLRAKGWTITDVGVTAPDQEQENTDLMFHRIGLRVGAMIAEGEFERALIFCGTGMGITSRPASVLTCTRAWWSRCPRRCGPSPATA